MFDGHFCCSRYRICAKQRNVSWVIKAPTSVGVASVAQERERLPVQIHLHVSLLLCPGEAWDTWKCQVETSVVSGIQISKPLRLAGGNWAWDQHCLCECEWEWVLGGGRAEWLSCFPQSVATHVASYHECVVLLWMNNSEALWVLCKSNINRLLLSILLLFASLLLILSL